MMDKQPLDNPKLSLRAKGLLAYLLSKPPDWRVQIEDICNHCKERPYAVRAALKELVTAGHAKLLKEKSGTQMDGSVWLIHEKAIPEITVSRISENHHLTNNELSTKNKGSLERGFRKEYREPARFEDFKNFPPPETSISRFTPEDLASEFKSLLEKHIGILPNSHFYPQWVSRFAQAPWRTLWALSYAQEDISFLRLSAPTESVKNPSGMANWYFLNIDLENHQKRPSKCRM